MKLDGIPTEKLKELKSRIIKARNKEGRWDFWWPIYMRVLDELDKRYKSPYHNKKLFGGNGYVPFKKRNINN